MGIIMKKILSYYLCLAMILTLIFVGNIDACSVCAKTEGKLSGSRLNENILNENNTSQDVLELQSKSVILIEANTGTVIFEKNADEMLRPASVTKIMTLLLIFDEISNGSLTLEDIVTVSEHAASMGGSQCFFEAGEQQKVNDMIKCIEIASGNDAAVAMAEHIAGSEDAFVGRMNERAKELGMVNTHFENACGLEAEGHLTSARDISIMARELLTKHPEIIDYSTIWMDSIMHHTRRGDSKFDLANTNKFLNQYTGATGLKTGYTSQAKYCMAASATRNGVELIAVIMGADTKEIRNREAGMLLDYGFANCVTYQDENVLENDLYADIKNGVKNKVLVKCEPIANVVLFSGTKEDVEKKVILYENLKAPIKEGDILGCVQYSVQGKLIKEMYLYSSEDIAKNTISYSLDFAIDRFLK